MHRLKFDALHETTATASMPQKSAAVQACHHTAAGFVVSSMMDLIAVCCNCNTLASALLKPGQNSSWLYGATTTSLSPLAPAPCPSHLSHVATASVTLSHPLSPRSRPQTPKRLPKGKGGLKLPQAGAKTRNWPQGRCHNQKFVSKRLPHFQNAKWVPPPKKTCIVPH